MKLGLKFVLSFTGIALLLLLIGGVGIITSRQTIDAFNIVVTSTTPALDALQQAKAQAAELRETAFDHALESGLRDNPGDQQHFADLKAEIDSLLAQYQAVVEETSFYEEISAAEAIQAQAAADLMQLADSGAAGASITSQIDTLNDAEDVFTEAIDKTIRFENDELQSELAHTETTAMTAQIIYVISMIVIGGGALLLGYLLARSVLRPVRRLQTAVNAMMQGDYSQRTVVTTRDEIGELAGAFNTMAVAIEKRDSDLLSANQTLEKRVEERTRELRVATREAQEASRLKDEFLSIMSHELRTPLNAIIGFQGIMLMTGRLDERGKHMIERAQANAERLLALINDVLDISRIESGRLQVIKSQLSLPLLTEKLQNQMGVLADEKHLDFAVEIDASTPEIILTDEDAITKIITNLLGNAFKFTDAGSVRLQLSSADDQLRIRVKDTGVGIPAHMHQVIFERFRQVDGSSQRAHGGSGLGLAIVQKLCSALGGTVQVQSVVGQGSTFTVTLPLESVQEGTPA